MHKSILNYNSHLFNLSILVDVTKYTFFNRSTPLRRR